MSQLFSQWQIWLMAVRPKTLWAAVAPVIIGTAMAFEFGGGHWLSALSALAGGVLIQIGTNLANDFYDYQKGADNEARLGPARVTQAGLVSPEKVRSAAVIAFSLALMIGVYLVIRGGWPIVIIGLLSILFGVLYTAGPLALGYTGLADLFVLVFFGPVAVGGTYYVQTLQMNSPVIIAGIAPGLFSVAILTVNNLRDVKTDAASGKKTLPVRFGVGFGKAEYFLSILAAVLIPLLLWFVTGGHPYAIASLVLLFFAIPSLKKVMDGSAGAELNYVLASTARLLFLYSVVFSVGWLL